ncbi:MAG: hypothetical protein KF855_09430 [Acidobacteria bacterium]|nr:hypothetical protein [Acidobacteriota bacterium]
MKIIKNTLNAFALIAIFAFFVAAQNTGEAVLVTEFGRTPCGDMIARQDYLFHELSKDPKAIGYAIIFSDADSLENARRVELTLNGQTEFRKFDDSKFRVVHAVGQFGLNVQFWIVPEGADLPPYEPVNWPLGTSRKPFIFNRSDGDVGPCPSGHQFKVYADILNSYPGSKGHVVLWTRTKRQFEKEKERVERDLVRKYSLGAGKIRYFYFRQRDNCPRWEYWVVPKRSKGQRK